MPQAQKPNSSLSSKPWQKPYSVLAFRSLSKRKKALVSEDNPINQKLIAAYLDALDLTFDITTNGIEAIKACRAKRYDIILMDLHMPFLDGADATRTIRSLNTHYAHVPIIAITANDMAEDLLRCWDAGMNGYLGKPFLLCDLQKTIEDHFRPKLCQAWNVAN